MGVSTRFRATGAYDRWCELSDARAAGSHQPDQPRRRRPTSRRLRPSLTLFAITIAAGYLALAILSVITPVAAVHGTWLPLHLLLAGAASTAMAGVMPFFSAESSWVSNQSSMVTGVPEKASPSD